MQASGNLVEQASLQQSDSLASWTMTDLTGEYYSIVLERFHSTLQPANYFEIGVDAGSTLNLACCPTIAVDPYFHIEKPVLTNKPMCLFFQMTSDRFFRDYKPASLFGRPVDFAFLDGMHLYEFLLRDFINTESQCKRNSVIMLHDCLPLDTYVARRDTSDLRGRTEPRKNMWAGDVWKVVAILKKYRPDLRILTYDAAPTGLVAITNLDPASNFLNQNYFGLIEEYAKLNLTECGNEYINSLDVIPTSRLSSLRSFSQNFWL